MLALASCLLFFTTFAAPPDDVAIHAVLDTQVEAWNRGDIPAFMQGYEHSDDITFAGAKGVTRGWQNVFERYTKSYGSKEKMGTLRFSEIEVRLVSADVALVLGKFELTRTAEGGGNASGRYSLVFKKTKDGWRIIHDHTS